jgi:hypothetical protein
VFGDWENSFLKFTLAFGLFRDVEGMGDEKASGDVWDG